MLSNNNSRSTNANCSSTTTSNYAPAGPTSSKIGSVAILNAVATFNIRHTTLHGPPSSNAVIATTLTAVAAFPTIRCNYTLCQHGPPPSNVGFAITLTANAVSSSTSRSSSTWLSNNPPIISIVSQPLQFESRRHQHQQQQTICMTGEPPFYHMLPTW